MEKLEGSTPDLYIGSLISLTSKSEIRYEGLLFTLDTEKSTIVLKDVRSFGTEGRGNNILQISASNKVYEYIIFRGTDIKDLKVLSLSGAPSMPEPLTQELAHPFSVKEVGHVPVSSSTWGWPLAPPSPGMQGGMSQCYWFYSPPINEAWGVPFIAPIAIIPSFVQQKKSNCYSSSSLQGANILSPLPKNASSEQVPDSIPAKVSSPDLSEALPVDTTASSKKLLVGDTLYTQVSPERKQTQNMSNKICKLIQPSSEQPLLPLPVSESEHQRLLEESLCSASLTHSRRHKRGLRRFRRGTRMRRGDPTKLCCEEVCSSIKEFSRDFDFKQGGLCSSIKEFSRDFDFEAMNEQFNKKQVWHDLEVEAHEDGGLNGEEKESFHNALNDKASTLRDSKKLLFIDDFFDPPSLEGDGAANKMQRTTPPVQLELDEETFGSRLSSRPRCRRRRPRKDRHGP